jgi:transposase InsO family protein
LTKWVKVNAIKDVTKKRVVEFLQENIFSRFGYPIEIVTDQGDHFTSNLIEKITQQHHIYHIKSTPYHPKVNGKDEVTNRELENILTKIVSMKKKN